WCSRASGTSVACGPCKVTIGGQLLKGSPFGLSLSKPR
ncbi:MAG: hypothetical protein RLZZ341_575, partial [Pseudomonadota bacterium]